MFATVACCLLLSLGQAAEEHDRWEEDIRQFEAQDQQAPPATGEVLFVGSSTIRMWDLKQSFPAIKTLNRGFGGSQMSDVLRYMDRIVFPYAPRIIVLYEGDNDLADGELPEPFVQEVKRFAEAVARRLPESKLVVLGIKPSIARWERWPQMKHANKLLADYCDVTENCQFVDVSRVMLNDQGKPMAELFVEDGLHLNAEGYARWSKLLRPEIAARTH
jgi:lysophospholipase L1-like esterase